VIKVLPGDTYRVVEVATDGREVYATTALTSQLKSWKIFREIGEEARKDSESSEDDGQQEVERDVRREVEGENTTHISRPERFRRLPARLADYQL